MLAVRNLEEENKYIFFATRNGLVKKSELREFMHVRSNGINAINIEAGDELVAARITNGNQIVFIASHEGMAIRFDENHVRPMGRAAYGVNGINLEEGDYVVGMTVTPKPGAGKSWVQPPRHVARCLSLPRAESRAAEAVDLTQKGTLILSVTENGYGKRTPADEYRLTNRGGKGVINVKTTERVGKVVAIAQVDETSRSHADQPLRQNHPHGFEHHPRIRPQRPRRPPAAHGTRRPRSRRRSVSARRRTQRQRRHAAAVDNWEESIAQV